MPTSWGSGPGVSLAAVQTSSAMPRSTLHNPTRVSRAGRRFRVLGTVRDDHVLGRGPGPVRRRLDRRGVVPAGDDGGEGGVVVRIVVRIAVAIIEGTGRVLLVGGAEGLLGVGEREQHRSRLVLALGIHVHLVHRPRR
jgi:hypothetical protein